LPQIGNDTLSLFNMKLLFDANLSHHLVKRLENVYPDSIHVRDIGFKQAEDSNIWQYAHDKDFVIVSKDSDFHELTLLRGIPPKFIWIRKRNCSTRVIEILLRTYLEKLQEFQNNLESSCFIIS